VKFKMSPHPNLSPHPSPPPQAEEGITALVSTFPRGQREGPECRLLPSSACGGGLGWGRVLQQVVTPPHHA
jgi:hypothetical protein